MGVSVEARSKIPPPHPKWNMTQNEILTAVIDGTLFGMIECDVRVPAYLREHFAEMLPVFKNALVTYWLLVIIQFLHADSISLTPPRARHPTPQKLL